VYAGGEAGQIYQVSLDGTVREIATTGGFIYGVALDGDGNVYACDFGGAAVMRIATDGEVSTYSTGTPERPLRVPNFAAFDPNGNLYVTDSGDWGADDGCIFRIAPSGETTLWTDQPHRFPNGCCLSLGGDALLVIESRGRVISRIPIGDDGSAGAITPVVDLAGSQPDGLALAEDGTMIVGCYRPDRLFRIDPDGSVAVLADDPDGVVLNQPANVVFVGPSRDRLGVSSLGGWSLMVADAGLVGAPLDYPKLG
jgi:gluconolactonase